MSAPFNVHRITDSHIPRDQEPTAERRYTDSLSHAPRLPPPVVEEPSPWLLRALLAVAFLVGYLVRSRRRVDIRVTND